VYPAPVFCTLCAARLEEREVPPGGKRVPVCPACGEIHWIDPKIAAGVLIVERDRVLLVKRGIEPGLGKWAFPGGHVDRGETIEAAALREAREECGVRAVLTELVGLYSYPGRPVVVAVYRGGVAAGSPEPVPLDETLDVGWFTADEVATLPLAFRSVADSLSKLFGRAYGL
jgi:mutator protein MutT